MLLLLPVDGFTLIQVSYHPLPIILIIIMNGIFISPVSRVPSSQSAHLHLNVSHLTGQYPDIVTIVRESF